MKRVRFANGTECFTSPLPRVLWLGQTKQDWHAVGVFAGLLAVLALINLMRG